MDRFARNPEDVWMDGCLHSTRVGRWWMPLDTRLCTFDEALLSLIGVDRSRQQLHIFEYFDIVHTADQPDLYRELAEVTDGKRNFDVTFRLIRPADGITLWINSRGTVHEGPNGVPTIYGVNYDVSPYKERENHSWVVAGEMGHRFKNLLSVVNAVFRISLANAKSLEDLKTNFIGRLEALRKLNDLLLNQAEGLEIDRLVGDILAPLIHDERMSISVEKGVRVNGGFAQMLALSLNELMTNAAKHGALRDNSGRISLVIFTDQGNDTLALEWIETGGDALTAPGAGNGFGMKVLQNMAGSPQGGEPVIEWLPGGLRYSCRWPIEKLTGN